MIKLLSALVFLFSTITYYFLVDMYIDLWPGDTVASFGPLILPLWFYLCILLGFATIALCLVIVLYSWFARSLTKRRIFDTLTLALLSPLPFLTFSVMWYGVLPELVHFVDLGL